MPWYLQSPQLTYLPPSRQSRVVPCVFDFVSERSALQAFPFCHRADLTRQISSGLTSLITHDGERGLAVALSKVGDGKSVLARIN